MSSQQYSQRPYTQGPSSSSPPSHPRAGPHLSMNLHELSTHTGHAHASHSSFSPNPHLGQPIGPHYGAPPLSPALYADGQPRSAMLDGTPVDLDPGSGAWMGDGRLRSMSSDSAVMDHYLNPSRGASLDLNGYFATPYHPQGATSPAPMMNGDAGTAPGDPHWHSSAMYPPSSHTPTLSTASISQPYPVPPSFYAAQTPSRQYPPAPIPVAYAMSQPQPAHATAGSFPSPSPSRSPPDHGPGSFQSPLHRQQSPITVKPPPSSQQPLLPLTIQLRSGTGKKKIWPNRTVLSSPSWSFSQLLFHAANLSTFVAVAVEGESMSSDARLKDAKAIRGYLASEAAGAAKIEVVFDLPANVKSCTRLGCPNLLVNKANRRACNVCQSQGADLFPGQIRLVHLPFVFPGGAAVGIASGSASTSSAYLDLYLDQFEHWKFDGTEEGLQYIVFTDEATAQRVQNEMSSNLHLHPHVDGSSAPSSLLQPVDPSMSYTIRMKSHFWMLQVKPLDPNASSSRVKLYKKVGKPNQSRVNVKGEKDADRDDKPATSKPDRDRDRDVPTQSSPHIHHDAHHGGGHSPISTESEGSSEHSYPSLPALAPHLLPSSPESFISDSSSAMSSPQITAGMHRKRHLDSDDPVFMEDGERRDSLSIDSDSHEVGSSPELGGFDELNRLFVSDAAFLTMKQNKPVQAIMSLVPHPQHLVVAAAMTNGGEPSTTPPDSAPSQVPSVPDTAEAGKTKRSTPVVLIYRDVEAYEKERRRMRKDGASKGGDKDKSGRRGGGGSGGGGGGGGDDGKPGKRDEESKGDRDDGPDHNGKRRRYDPASSSGAPRHYSMAKSSTSPKAATPTKSATSPRRAPMAKSVLPELQQSLLEGDVKDSALELVEYSSSEDEGDKQRWKAGDVEYGIDVVRGAGKQRMVTLPAELADLLEDRSRLEAFFSGLKDVRVIPDSSAMTKQLLSKPAILRELQFLQSTSLCTYFTLALGMLSLVLLIVFASGVADSSPMFYKDAPPAQSALTQQLLVQQSASVLSSMASISPVFNSWIFPNTSVNTRTDDPPNGRSGPGGGGAGGGGGGNNWGGGPRGTGATEAILRNLSAQNLAKFCMEAQVVAKALGDWLLWTQGLLEVYQNFGSQDVSSVSDSATATCKSIVNKDVGFAHLQKLVCSPINVIHYPLHTEKYSLCRAGSGTPDFSLDECTSMFKDFHANNLTATILLGLVIDDVDPSTQYQLIDNRTSPTAGVTEYLRVLRPQVQVVEMSAFGYYMQASALAPACAMFAVINQVSLDYSLPPDKAAGPKMNAPQGESKMMHPMMMLVILLGSSGLFMLIQMALLGLGRGAKQVYARIKTV